MLTDWDCTETQDIEKLGLIYQEWQNTDIDYSKLKQTRLNLSLEEFNPEQSHFFKKHMAKSYVEHEPLTTEIELIRKIEGW